jgi:hypothetical protein
MKTKIFIVAAFFLFLSANLRAQDYSNAVGVRIGLGQGITFKHFVTTTDALEGLLDFRWGGFNITGLYERHMTAFDVRELYFYYGAGAHIGFWDGYSNPWFDDRDNYTVIGIDGIVGLEYVFTEIPFNVSLDWKPALNVIGNAGFWGDNIALSFRFVF